MVGGMALGVVVAAALAGAFIGTGAVERADGETLSATLPLISPGCSSDLAASTITITTDEAGEQTATVVMSDPAVCTPK